MRACDINRGCIYRLKSSPNYGYIKVFCVLKPKETLTYKAFDGSYRTDTNKNNFIIVRCAHSSNQDFSFYLIRDFRPRDIVCLM